MHQKPVGLPTGEKAEDIHKNISHSFWKMHVGKCYCLLLEKTAAPYNDCFFENIKKNHNDDRVIVWYNVGQSGGNKG